MESFKILVAGGLGFIGGNLVGSLIDKHEVTIVDSRVYNEFARRYEKDVNYTKIDIADKESLFSLPRVDIVYNFASPSSILSYTQEKYLDLSSSTFTSFLNLLEWSKVKSVAKYIFPSSGTVYGSTSNIHARRLEPITIYGALKLTHEILSSLYSSFFDIIGLRIFMGYGPGEEAKGNLASPVYQFVSEVLKGSSPVIWGNGKQSRDLIYIQDVVEVLLKTLSLDGIRFFDVGTGLNTSFNEIIDLIREITNKNFKVKHIPKPSTYVEHTTADPDFMIRLLGKTPTAPPQGISDFINYLLEKQGLSK